MKSLNKSSGWNTRNWLHLRNAVQIIAFVGFIILFLNASQVLMGIDPLAMLANLISSRRFEQLSIAALIPIALALTLGRAWCGWLCPLGTILDWFSLNKFRPAHKPPSDGWRSVKYVALVAIVTAAVFSNLTLLVLDPLTIMMRTFTVSFWPALDFIVHAAESALYNIPPLQEAVGQFDNLVRPLILPVDPLPYRDGLLVAAIFAAIILLNLAAERFWCRYICPLGAFYGLLSKISMVRRRVDESCIKCKLCEDTCPTGTIRRDSDCSSDPGECVVCLKCMDACPCSTSDFGRVSSPGAFNSYDPGKRQLLLGLGAAALLATVFRLNPLAGRVKQSAIRPPGTSENDMMARCIRCGECIKACPTAAIQPSRVEEGVETYWTPVLVMRTGFCQYSCNACGQACPVVAIPALRLAEKQVTPIGRAYIDRNRCLPWANNTPCVVCEEMCPVPHKAIILDTVQVKTAEGSSIKLQRPTVLPGRCIGCGLCEYKCPVSGEAAIRVQA